ncbi:glycoside hydrolase superfamily [Collybia nuda]|uniref:Glycoside hydrolase superfamily n=1 Tax=Collybia nuda TaxID=64659 RepID=A0A9P5XWI2_9AGAR|nr:glycoside hydrolase superfamily [Collybia nuda]
MSRHTELEDDDIPLLQQLLDVRQDIPGLKVIIALGGWDFLEAIPMKDIFSVMISAAANRAVFIASVKIFLNQNNLDGIDINFEYPAAIEHNAPATGVL